jgi:HSP20 family protein
MRTSVHLAVLATPASDVEWVPNTDIYENGNSLVIRMEIAGVHMNDIRISVRDRLLIVAGRRPDSCRSHQCHFRQMEIHYGSFERHLTLPRNVDSSHAKAHYRNGFLIIELPKSSQAEHATVRVAVESE